MSKRKIKESKEKIYSLAQSATNKIYENKFLSEQIFLYKTQINLIKETLIKFSKMENDKNSQKLFVYENINNIHNSLKTSNNKLKEEKNKLSEKYDAYETEIFNEETTLRQNLNQAQTDYIILESKVKEKSSNILKYNEEIKEIGKNRFFPPDKREVNAKKETCRNILDYKLNDSLKDLNRELIYFNMYNTHCIKYNTKKKKLSVKIKLLEQFKEILENFINNRVTKKFEEDEKNNILLKEISNKNNNKTSKNKNGKINILTVSELFDVNNNEGKSEEIIDDELHSDDEIIFEPKVKPPKKVGKDENLKKIKSQVPNIDLSQIEFNKQKVMNEGDLYSFENRLIQAQDIDEQLSEMRFKHKQILRKFKTNIKKLQAMKNFVKDTKNNYKFYKSMKIKTSVFVIDGMNNFNKNMNKEKDEEEIKMEEIKEEDDDNNETGNEDIEDNEEKEENLVEDNYLMEQNIEFTKASLSERKKKKVKKNKKKKKKKEDIIIKVKIKRAKSK